jgi:XTP/dITP diphosphohydrolase
LTEPKRAVYFVTENRNKYVEAARIAASFGVIMRHLKLRKQEIQSQKLSDIASFAAKQAAESTRKSIVVEDAGFSVRALSGFPGPYSSYVFDTLGWEGILRLLYSAKNREALFEAVVAYCEPSHRPMCFAGSVKGTVTRRAKGSNGFGFDPIFVPRGNRRTFAEMSAEEKNLYSHRAKAFTKFCKWFASRS